LNRCQPRGLPIKLYFDLPGGIGNQLFALFASRYVYQSFNLKSHLIFKTIDRHHTPSGFDIRSLSLYESEHLVRKSVSDTFLQSLYYPNNRLTNVLLRRFLRENRVNFHPNNDRVSDVDAFFGSVSSDMKWPRRISGYFGDFHFYDLLNENHKHIALATHSGRFSYEQNKIANTETLGIHLRLGDFLQNRYSVGVLNDSYYLSAIEELQTKYERILIFTNDINLAKIRICNWKIRGQIQVLESQTHHDPSEDLILLSECKAIITANSTFSFWAAKLGIANEIIYPSKFRKDDYTRIQTIPEHWKPHTSLWET
jgi:hypothetical protein